MDARNRAVVVIHGIGDQRQGETVERLASSYFANGAVKIDKSTLWLPEHVDVEGNGDKVDAYSVELVKVEKDPNLLFAEVYWADISRVLAGFLGFFVGVWQILTGLRFVIEEAAHPESDAPVSPVMHGVFWLGRAINFILVGPLVAMNILLLTLTIGVFWDLEGIGEEIAFLFTALLFIGVLFWLSKTEYVTKTTLLMTLGSLFYFIFHVTVIYEPSFYLENIRDYGYLLIRASSIFWSILAILVWILLSISGVVFLYFSMMRRHWPSLVIACAGPCLSVGLWSFVLANFWMFVLHNVLPRAGTINVSEVVEAGIPFLSLIWLSAICVGGALLMVFLGRRQVAKRKNNIPADWLRLIFSPVAVIVILLFASLWIVATVNAWFATEDRNLIPGIQGFIDFLNLKIVSVVAVVLGLFGIFMRKIGQALDLLLDIVTYFRQEKSNVSMSFPRKNGGDDDHEPTRNFKTRFLKREKIADRFRSLIYHLVHHMEVDEITVVAHSQGTVTAIRELETIDDWLDEKRPAIKLITMGSPYTHVYEYYFPRNFDVAKPKVDQWINIYAIDDYVGTVINGKTPTAPTNIPVAAIGHNGYWTDIPVMNIIQDKSAF